MHPGPSDSPAAFQFSAMPPRQSLVDSVVDQLAAQIESGGAAPGSRLPAENEMCRQFGVSRTVVREAIARLKADPLVETQPGLGLFVVRRAPGQGVQRLRGSEGSAVERARENASAPRQRRAPPAAARAAPRGRMNPKNPTNPHRRQP